MGDTVKDFVIDDQGGLIVLHKDGVLRRMYQGAWSTLTPEGSQPVSKIVSDASGGGMLAMVANGDLYHWFQGGWSGAMDTVKDFAIDDQGAVVVLHKDGNLNRFYGVWAMPMPEAGQPVSNLSSDGQGSVWVVLGNSDVYLWSNSAWTAVTGVVATKQKVTLADGTVWFLGSTPINSQGYCSIYYFSAGQLVQAPGAGSGIGIGNGSVWMINPAGQVYNWSGTRPGLNQVAYEAADGSMWFLGSTMPSAPGYRYDLSL